MASESLYRKWRSQTFSDMVGQEPVIRTLKNGLISGKLAHAYLFTGPRGTGKTSTARLLAKTINCQNPQNGEPCNVCDQCREITNGSSFNVSEIDAASNRGIDSIRELRDKVMMPPTTGKYKVYILDEAHMLTTEAFNALLKTLEEPPPYAIFVLATTDVHKMLPTVLSRCQRFEFKRFTLRQLVDRLYFVAQQEHVELRPGSAELIARAASGGMRDALSLLDQAIAYAGNIIDLSQIQAMLGVADPRAIQKFIVHIADLESPPGLHLINDLTEAGADLRQINTQVAEYWRAMMLGKAGANVGAILENTDDEIKEILELARRFTLPELTECARIFAQNELLLRSQATPQLGLELAFLNCIEIHQRAQEGPQQQATTYPTLQSPVAGPHQMNTSPARASQSMPHVPSTPSIPLTPPSAMQAPEYDSIDLQDSISESPQPSQSYQAPPPAAPPAQREYTQQHTNNNINHAVRPGNGVPQINLNGNGTGPVANLGTGASVPPPIVPAMQPAAVSNAISLTVEDVKERWELVRRRVRTRKDGAKISALLSGYAIVGVEGTYELPIVVCLANADFHFKTLQNEEYQETIHWALKITLERECKVRLLPPNTPYNPPPASSAPVPRPGGPLPDGSAPSALSSSAPPSAHVSPPHDVPPQQSSSHTSVGPLAPRFAAVSVAEAPVAPPYRVPPQSSDVLEVTAVTEIVPPRRLAERAVTRSVQPDPVLEPRIELSSQSGVLARNTPVSENTTSRNDRVNAASLNTGTRRETIEKQVRNNPVIAEALRLFKAEIKDIQPK